MTKPLVAFEMSEHPAERLVRVFDAKPKDESWVLACQALRHHVLATFHRTGGSADPAMTDEDFVTNFLDDLRLEHPWGPPWSIWVRSRPFVPLVCTDARRRTIDGFRSYEARMTHEREAATRRVDTHPDHSLDVIANEDGEMAIDRLTRKEFDAFRLKVVLDQTYEEISFIMNISERTVARLRLSASRKLRRVLAESKDHRVAIDGLIAAILRRDDAEF